MAGALRDDNTMETMASHTRRESEGWAAACTTIHSATVRLLYANISSKRQCLLESQYLHGGRTEDPPDPGITSPFSPFSTTPHLPSVPMVGVAQHMFCTIPTTITTTKWSRRTSHI
ncbi:hypothetical protein Bbelb_059370 [Branchiostoma belcheri]|nr:hypothetical protein Bbelb_059370 [Branchiostoma belcheri]